MLRMDTVTFFHPPTTAVPSGGHRYNQRIMRQAARQQFPLQPVCVPPGGGVARYPATSGGERADGIRLWDSLLMPVYAASRQAAAGSDAWLMHFLPSANPLLTAADAARARRLEDRIAASSGLFLTTGDALADILRQRYPRSRVWLCEPGVDAVYARAGRVRRQTNKPQKRLVLLTVANLVPAKGYDELAAMLRGLLDMDWCWHVVGSADVEPVFAARFVAGARDLIDAGRIVFHGVLQPEPLAALMAQTDLYVSASHFEAYGMALAEAVAAGLPVVTTAVGDAARIVGRANAGPCVPVGQWGLFARCVAETLADLARGVPVTAGAAVRARTWRQGFDAFASALEALPAVRAGLSIA